MTEHLNITGTDTCPICQDDGIIELLGTITVHGVTYSRGSTTCKWCEEGLRRYVRAVSPPRNKDDHHRKWQPAQDYTLKDVHHEDHGRLLTKKENKQAIAQLLPQLGQP